MKKMCFILLTICIVGMACKKDESKKEEQSLANTKWKLIGIMDAKASILTELEPKDCEECYTLTFDTDTTATARSINNVLKLDLLHLKPSEINLEDILWCEKYDKDGKDYCDSDTFCRAIILTESYIITSNELKLYVFNSNNYLSFKLFKTIVQ